MSCTTIPARVSQRWAGELQARVAETTCGEEKASAGAVQSCRGRLWGQKRRWYLTRTTCSRTSTRVRQRQEDGKCETIVKRGIRRNVLDPEGTSCCAAAHSAQRRPEERILVSRSGPPENVSLTMCVEVRPRRTFWTWPALADHQGPFGAPRPP